MYNWDEKKATPFMDELKNIDEESYIDVMNALKEKFDNDMSIPNNERKRIDKAMANLFELLVNYSA